jgi:imidazoleglycerol-phosphate dehydratase/histidinol-phosphatase
MKKVLFIDRDGTLIKEPAENFQVDSLEKLEFYPGVFNNLYKISKFLDYELVIVTNQDGMGTKIFPHDSFIKPHEKFLKAFENENIHFSDVLVDSSMPGENADTRKPGLGMLKKFLAGGFDLQASYVIGDRLTDIELARNLGSKGILIGPMDNAIKLNEAGLKDICMLITESWEDIWIYLSRQQRSANVNRITNETDVQIRISLDGSGIAEISTGLGFFDHMLEQIAKHAAIDLTIKTVGDLHVDEHHTVEDTAIALGEAFSKALGTKRGISRYGFLLPMDDSLAQVAIDFGGRPWLEWTAEFKREKIGDVPTELFYHFFKSFTDSARCNLNIKVEGSNEHHKIEAIFKAFSKAIRMAIKLAPDSDELPSTKGVY